MSSRGEHWAGRLGHPVAGCTPLHPGIQQVCAKAQSGRLHRPQLNLLQITFPAAVWEKGFWRGVPSRAVMGVRSRLATGVVSSSVCVSVRKDAQGLPGGWEGV